MLSSYELVGTLVIHRFTDGLHLQAGLCMQLPVGAAASDDSQCKYLGANGQGASPQCRIRKM